MEREITYKGKSMITKHYCEISDDEFYALREAYYQRPDIEEVKKEIRTISRGG